jgi:EmrB/QacA subfamily drug resistance transporter
MPAAPAQPPQAARAPQAAGRARPAVILGVLSLGALAYAVLSSAVIPALPVIQRGLHTSETGVTWLLTGFLLSASVGTAIIGKLGDLYGKRRMLVWTLLILSAGTLLSAVAGSLPLVIAGRVVQGVAGGIFPLAFSIMRDEFPPEKVPGSIGLMSSILGVGGGGGLVIGGLIAEHLSWHWLFWVPLMPMSVAAACTWRFIPESRVRASGRVNWLSASLMSTGMCAVLIAIAQTTVWGWGSTKTLSVLGGGLAVCAIWIAAEFRSPHPLIDMSLMAERGVWATNLAAFLLGAGMYAAFLLLPQFAQLPRITGFGYGSSVVEAGLYLLPCALGMGLLGSVAGRVERRFSSRLALIAGSAISAVACGWLVLASRPVDMLICSALLGIGIGLAFAALGNLIVQAVPADQTGVASGMNTVVRTLGGAVGGQVAATLVVGHTMHALPRLTGFTDTFALSALLLLICVLAGLVVPSSRRQQVPAPADASVAA